MPCYSRLYDHRKFTYKPWREKTNNLGFRAGQTQTSLYSPRSRLEACDFGFKKKRDCTVCVTKRKALISFAVTAKAQAGLPSAPFFSHMQIVDFLMRQLKSFA